MFIKKSQVEVVYQELNKGYTNYRVKEGVRLFLRLEQSKTIFQVGQLFFFLIHLEPRHEFRDRVSGHEPTDLVVDPFEALEEGAQALRVGLRGCVDDECGGRPHMMAHGFHHGRHQASHFVLQVVIHIQFPLSPRTKIRRPNRIGVLQQIHLVLR